VQLQTEWEGSAGTILRRNNRTIFAISLIAALFVLTAACGDSSTDSPVQTPVQAKAPVLATAIQPTSSLPDEADDKAPSMSTSASPEPIEPVLVNTPVPVANLAPDFRLPSIEGAEHTLSDFRGEQPVLVVFYRAYW